MSVSNPRTKILMVGAAAIVTAYACEAFLFWDPLEFRGPHPRKGFDLTTDLPREMKSDILPVKIERPHRWGALIWGELPPTRSRFIRLTITDWPRNADQPPGIMSFIVFGKYVSP